MYSMLSQLPIAPQTSLDHTRYGHLIQGDNLTGMPEISACSNKKDEDIYLDFDSCLGIWDNGKVGYERSDERQVESHVRWVSGALRKQQYGEGTKKAKHQQGMRQQNCLWP